MARIIEISKSSTDFSFPIDELLNIYPQFILDLGVGTGESSLHLAKENPEILVIAIERTSEKFSKFKRKLVGDYINNFPNLLAVHGDFNRLVPTFHHLLSRLQTVFWFYPNPCPKIKNKRFRFYNQTAFQILLKNQKDYSYKIICRSDIIDLLANASSEAFSNPHQLNEIFIDQPITNFEKKYLDRNERFFQLELFGKLNV